ncbi:uncharacterized protein FFFS_16026 [Fusarium fujikuroi]
MGSLL